MFNLERESVVCREFWFQATFKALNVKHSDPLGSKPHHSDKPWCLKQALGIISRAQFDFSLCCSKVVVLLAEIRNPFGGQDSLCHSHLWNICSISLAFSLIARLEGDGKVPVVESHLGAVLTCFAHDVRSCRKNVGSRS